MDSASTAEAPLPTHPRDLTPELLTAVISQMHPGARVEAVELLDAVGVGGMVSTAGRGKLRVKFAPGGPALPERIQVKMIVGERSPVPPFIYETEVGMYRRMLPGVAMERALCLGAAYHRPSETFLLLLEDLTQRGATFTNVLETPYSPQTVGVLLDQLDALHAQFWESPRLDAEAGWLSSHRAGRQFEILNGGHIVKVLEGNVASSPYRQDFCTRAGFSSDELFGLVQAVQRHQVAALPPTLCHGDTGAHNTYRLPDGRAGFVDWQLSVKGGWTHDVHYLICTALSVKDRRDHEEALIARYLDRLQALGCPYRTSLDEAMAEYSLAIVWGLVIGWFSVRPSMYGMEIISANVERLYAAACDHRTLSRVAALP
jgi:hypothetical protein